MDEKNDVFIDSCSSEKLSDDILKDIRLEIRNGESSLPISLQGVISIESIEDVLSKKEKEALEKIYLDGKVRMWGTTSDNSWKFLKEGDLVLFYKDGKYIYGADVVCI